MQIIRKKVQDMASVFRTFDSEEEAVRIADFFNSQVNPEGANEFYRFKVMKFNQKEADDILNMNRYLEHAAIDNPVDGFYIMGVNTKDQTFRRDYSAQMPAIFTNENGELILSKVDLNVKAKVKGLSRYSVNRLGRPEYPLPNPFGEENIISTLDGKQRITNQIIRTDINGVQNIQNADYRSVAENLFTYMRTEDYSQRTYGKATDGMAFTASASYATRHQANISGKTSSDLTSLGMVKGTEGQNLGSTNAYNIENYFISPGMMEEYNSDFKPMLREGEVPLLYNLEFKPNGDLNRLKVSLKDANGKFSERYIGESQTGPIKSSARFREYYNNKVSMARNVAAPNYKVGEVMSELNSIMDEYSNTPGAKVKSYIDRIQSTIINSYDGDNLGLVKDLFNDDGGVLSRDMISSMLLSGRRFHDLLDVNRQSINTNDSVTPMSGAIMDLFGSFNKIGQRNAQSDAKMSKAIIRVNGADFNMSSVAKSWASNVEELAYKNVGYENVVANELLEKGQMEMYGEKLNSSYYSQQNYMLQTFHNGAFQDSNIIATDLALENISKYDSKNTMFVSYNALTPYAIGDYGAVDYTKLNNDNAYVEGTIENTIFRNLIGDENYQKHINAKAGLVEEYKNIGQRLNGITNLQNLEDRKLYAEAYDAMLGDVNDIMAKYMTVSDSAARVQIFDDNAVTAGQFKHLTGVNFAYIDGVEFGSEGIRVKTSGIINHGDSVKFTNGSVKSTTQAIMPSLGLNTVNGYIPISGLNNEKMLSKKRGFTGELLERTLSTLAFNYTTMGNSDNYEDNFNSWKKAMTNDFTVEAVNGKRVNLFDALGVDVTYNNGNISFRNIDTQEALGGFNFRTGSLTGSVNKKLHGLIEKRAFDFFGIDMADYDGKGKGGKQFTDKLFSILSDAEDGLSSMITGSKGNLSENERRGLMSILQRGSLEAINISGGKANVTGLGEVKGLRLLNIIHAMQETKSRAESEGLSLGRLTMQVARESGFERFADVLEETIAVNNVADAEKYVALSGAMDEYKDITSGRGYEIFSNVENAINMKDKALRYNVNGVNTTLENYMESSPLGNIIKNNFNLEKGSLDNIITGKLVGFDAQFLDVSKKMIGPEGIRARSKALSTLSMSDFSMFLDKKAKIDDVKKESLLGFLTEADSVVRNILIQEDVGDGIAAPKMRALRYIMENMDKESYQAFTKKVNLENVKPELIKLVTQMAESDYDINVDDIKDNIKSNKLKYISNDSINRIIAYAKGANRNLNTVISGEQALKGEWDPSIKIKDVDFDSDAKRNAQRILNWTMEGIADTNFDSDFNMASLFVDRINDYTGRNAFNLKQLSELATTDSLRYLLDEVSADADGVIINKSNLAATERLIKLNSDLGLLNEKLELYGSDLAEFEEINKINSEFSNTLKGAKDKFNKMVNDGDENAIKIKDTFENMMTSIEGSKHALTGGLGFTSQDYEKLSTSRKVSMFKGVTEKGLIKSLDATNPEIKAKIENILSLKKETLSDISNAFISMGESSTYMHNAAVALNRKAGHAVHGTIMETVIDDFRNGRITSTADLEKTLSAIDKAIHTSKGPNPNKAGMNTMLSERDQIRKIISKSMDNFFKTSDFSGDSHYRKNVLEVLKGVNSYDYSKADSLTLGRFLSRIADKIDVNFGDVHRTRGSFELGFAATAIRSLNDGASKDIRKLTNERASIQKKMLSAIVEANADLSENFFRKAGVAEGFATTRFKNSVEFSPMEKTISSDYLMDEFNKIAKGVILGDDVESIEKDLFKAMGLIYGKEVTADIASDYETAKKFNKVEEFRKGLKSRVDEFSGIVIGSRDDFENAGLGKTLSKDGTTTIRYGFLSRNPHQYQGSLRSTRYVALSDEDKNLSFLKGLFGDGNKMAGTQGHLGLVGKRTAISAHGDHDGDKFQALITGIYDFLDTFGGNKEMSKEFIKSHNNNLRMYQLLADYKGNLKKSIESGNLTKVEDGILEYARNANNINKNISNQDVFKSIEHIYYSQKMERLRTAAEVMDENLSHAEIAFFKKVKGKKNPGLDAFEELVSKMDDTSKLSVMANTFGYDDLENIEKFFDPKMMNDAEFADKVKKIKSISKDRDLAKALLDEFGVYGIGKIKWNNTTLAESSYSAYTGISRTGSVHYALTNIRDSAASLFSSKRRKLLTNALDGRGLTDEIRKSLDSLADNYVDSGRFWMPINELDGLIDKLAISSKLSDGSNPYQKVDIFKKSTDAITIAMERVVRNGEDVNAMFKFNGMKDIYRKLADNAEDVFDLDDFISGTGTKVFDSFSSNKEVNDTVYDFMKFNLFGGKDGTLEELFKNNKVTNKKVMQTLGNVYTMLGQGVLSVSSGILDGVVLNPGSSLPHPYSRGRTNLFQKAQNFLYGMGVAFDRPMETDGYNPTIGVFGRMKELLQEKTYFVKTGTKKPDPATEPIDAAKEAITSAPSVANTSAGDIVEDAPKPKMLSFKSSDVNIYKNEEIVENVEEELSYLLWKQPVKRGRKPQMTARGAKGRIPKAIQERANDIERVQQQLNFDAVNEAEQIVENNKTVSTMDSESKLIDTGAINAKYESRIKELEEQINSNSTKISDLEGAYNAKDNEYKSIQAELNSITSQLDDEKINSSDAKDKIARLTAQLDEVESERSMFKDTLNKSWIENNKQVDELKKEIHRIQSEHRSALNNLNFAKDKAIKKLESELEAAKKTIENQSAKITKQIGENSELRQVIDNAKTIKGSTKAVYDEVGETISKVGDNAKKVYNNHKKFMIGAGITAILGTALSLVQKNRPIVDVDIRDEEYERANGSVYRNLGSYTINTNIRSIR